MVLNARQMFSFSVLDKLISLTQTLMKMTPGGIFLLCIFLFVKQTAGQDIRSFRMFILSNLTFQCAQTTCLPFSNLTASNIRQCQMTCLRQTQCTAAIYYESTSVCQLFDSTINQNGNMSYNINAVTMIIIPGTRVPSG